MGRSLRSRLSFLTLLLVCQQALSALPAMVDDTPLPSLAPMLERVTPAVVNIATRNHIRSEDHPLLSDPFFRWFFDSPRRSPNKRQKQSLGSGVVVDAAKGYVLTNHHVVAKADEIEVTLKDGRKLQAELVGADPETDVAVLRIPTENLTAVELANSDRLRVGDFVVAIGNPFGLSQTVTSGIVSALDRSGLGIEGYENFIQTDASINPGNSGGPLVDLRGRLVGINTAIIAPGGGNVGIGFAIPINMAKAIMTQIVEYGGVNRGLFGVHVQQLTPELAQALDIAAGTSGAVIIKVEPESPADKAGLRQGDVVVHLNGREIKSAPDLHNRIALLRVGDTARMKVIRNGRTHKMSVRIADPYADYVDGKSLHRRLAGAIFGESKQQSSRGFIAGVAVGRIDEGSPVLEMGLEEGDLLLVVNESRVETLDDLEKVIRSARKIYQLKLMRGGRIITLINR
jgi:Do/DeqQ family serine protease